MLLCAEDYDALLETVDVLSRAEEVQALKEGLDDLDARLTSPLDEVRSAILRHGRLRRRARTRARTAATTSS